MYIRQFDATQDKLYSPDATPNLYLSGETVLSVLDGITKYPDPSEQDVRNLIIEIETLNRNEKLGKITAQECLAKNQLLARQFSQKHGFWPYVTKTYQDFYNHFDSTVN